MSELPAGWARCVVGDLGHVKGGKRLPKGSDYSAEPTEFPYVRVSDFDKGSVALNRIRYIDEHVQATIGRYTISSEDVYVSIAGTIGLVGTVPKVLDGANLTENAAKVSDLKGCNRDFLVQFLSSSASKKEMLERRVSTTQPKLALHRISSLEVSLPPLNEQKRIVAKIDALTEKSREAREALDEVPELLDKLRQSILAAAFRGDLTHKWREQNPGAEPASILLQRIRTERRTRWEEAELAKMQAKGKEPKDDKWKAKYKEPEPVDTEGLPELPEGWCWARFPELGELARGKSKHRPRNDPKLFGQVMPFLQTGDVAKANGTITSYKTMYSELGVRQSRIFPKGTLCITIAANIADTALLGFDACFPDSVVGFTPERPLDSSYFEYFIRTAKENITQFAPGTAQKNINLEILSQVAVPFAPFQEAMEIVRLANEAMAGANDSESASKGLFDSLPLLDASILAKAFRGELVPQDPSDEPASVLLERIKTQREAAAPKKKGTKKKAKKS